MEYKKSTKLYQAGTTDDDVGNTDNQLGNMDIVMVATDNQVGNMDSVMVPTDSLAITDVTMENEKDVQKEASSEFYVIEKSMGDMDINANDLPDVLNEMVIDTGVDFYAEATGFDSIMAQLEGLAPNSDYLKESDLVITGATDQDSCQD